MNHPERRLLISVDMERYSRRGNVRQYEAQQAFQQLLHEAATAVGLDRISWKTQQAGDGELAILPADAREPQVIGRLVPDLNRRLRHYNSSRLPEARVRLRVALHQGLVHLDGANGFPGTAVIEVCRLCDARQLKKALTLFPDAGVALIVSSGIYREVVSEYPEELRPERFRRIEVHLPDKDFRESAWICVVDEDLSAVPTEMLLAEPTPGPGQPEPGTSSEDGPALPGTTAGGADPAGAINVGGIRVVGQNAVGHGAMAIGSIGEDANFGGEGRAR
ncbi:hypothetical protein [Plantactinospora endophytica]|uniref:NYN domain-containing protein n=1 Tax=Plantactinospora endophytica TaxID=673535 RepID=A0ABQ4EDS6_9ACTN|nr:hypothetical protein [Plantactinospora endophytica]GIG92402.1 hypothetical protein Pen02_73380 [Plantactinospora endophytica]